MALYLVTGGAGFIGSHIAEALLKRGERVRILDDLSTGLLENIEALPGGFDFIRGDICDAALMTKAAEGCEVIFHEAAVASVPRSVEDPLVTNRASVDGTLSVLLAARRSGVRRVVYASSSAAYGDSPTLPKRESQPTAPISPYGVAKLTGEMYAHAFYRCYGLETVSLRYFNVFGPRQDPKSMYAGVTPIFVREMLAGRAPTIFGDGEQTRDFTYIANVVDANLSAATATGAAGRVFNCAAGQQVSVNRLYRSVAKILGFPAPPVYAPPRAGDILHSVADISAAREVLAYAPAVSLEDGLKLTVDWLRTQKL